MSANPNPMQSGTMYPPGTKAQHPLRKLPGFYARAITQPTPRTFSQTAEYATWHLIWPQILFLLLLPLILGGLRLVFKDTSSGVDIHKNLIFGTIDVLTVGISIGATILKALFVPIIFFIGATLQYLFARVFGGRGGYREQCFSMLIYQVPLALIGFIAIAVLVILHISTLFFSPFISIVLFCYGVILNIAVIMGIHRLGQNKATLAFIIPYVLGVLAACGVVTAVAHSFLNMLH